MAVAVDVLVNNPKDSIKKLRNKMQKEGNFKKLKLCRFYESNTRKKQRKAQERQQRIISQRRHARMAAAMHN